MADSAPWCVRLQITEKFRNLELMNEARRCGTSRALGDMSGLGGIFRIRGLDTLFSFVMGVNYP